ncbi:ubiquitin family protein [Ceratobasidium sp. AG-Ba]|nr:ubiquitin family protein [Ceratobasidium sp. AG-Ba]
MLIPQDSSKALPYLVATFGSRSTTLKRDADYQAMISSLQQAFKELRELKQQDIILSAKLPDYGADLIRIAEATWTDIVDTIKAIEITLPSRGNSIGAADNSTGDKNGPKPRRAVSAIRKRRTALATQGYNLQSISAQIKSYRCYPGPTNNRIYSAGYTIPATLRKGSQTFPLSDLHPSYYIGTIKYRIEAQYGPMKLLQKLQLNGQTLDDGELVSQVGIDEHSVLDLELGTRHSLIYLIAPEASEDEPCYAHIKIAVNRAWELVALAPSVNREYHGFTQNASFRVRVEENNMLRDGGSDQQLEYLSWDGFREQKGFLFSDSPATAAPVHSKEWLETVTTIEPHNSVAIPTDYIKTYLEEALDRAGCEVTAKFVGRFIAEIGSKPWKNFAIRLLSPNDSAALSSLEISKRPTKVTHIAILYKALDDVEVEEWNASIETINSVKKLSPSDEDEDSEMKEDENGALRVCMISWLEIP